jgi:anthranilate synthase component 2
MRVLFIDNFDSFTYNLVDEFEKRGAEVKVFRNNVSMELIDDAVQRFTPQLIVVSPGPASPRDAGNSMAIIERYHTQVPILGVCLGHQAIIEAFGGKVGRAPEIIHGKPSRIDHDGEGLFAGLSNPFQAGRYHSLAGLAIPPCLEVTARTESGIVMGVRHKEHPVEGVQFHPESILTPVGGLIIQNAIAIYGGKGR